MTRLMSDLGAVTIDGDRASVRFERTYSVPPDELWSALTEPERLARWLAPVEGDLRVGGQVKILFDDGRAGVGHLLIRECDRPRTLVADWTFTDEDQGQVRAAVTPRGDGCRLEFEHRRLPAAEAVGTSGGWHAHLVALGSVLAGQPVTWADIVALSKEAEPRYAAALARPTEAAQPTD